MKRNVLLGIILYICLISLFSCGGPAAPQTVQVTLTDYHIASNVTTFTHNTPYHFVITNKGLQVHEFMISPPMMSMNISMEQMDKMALAHISNISPGTITTLDYTFAQAYPAGKLEFACHIDDHYQKGMHLSIAVQ